MRLSVLVVLALAIAGCATSPEEAKTTAEAAPPALEASIAGLTNARGLHTDNFDRSVRACDDFYQYANGGWISRNPVPAAYTNWGIFNELEQRNEKVLREILNDLSNRTDLEPASTLAKLRDFYTSAMDVETIETRGITPIALTRARIAALNSAEEVVAFMADELATGASYAFGLFVNQDLKDNTQMLLYAGQGGLSLPERDYYLNPSPASAQIRDAFVAHVQRMYQLAGVAPQVAAEQARAVLAIETRLAQASLSRVEQRDPANRYNPVTIAEANAITPAMDWAKVFGRLGIDAPERFSLTPARFYAELSTLLVELPVADWRAYLDYHLLADSAPHLSQSFVDEHFAFYGTTLRGAKELQERFKRVLATLSGLMGDPLSEAFVARAYPPEAEAKMAQLIENLRLALRERIEQLPWMSEATRARALEKWASFTPKIGYPKTWRDYSMVSTSAGDYYGNLRSAARATVMRNLAKLGKPIDRSEWGMNAYTVNAYYNPVWNEIVFPAGILQPPFFDFQADDALNYGAIGAVIGHELLHGFDDQGSKYDAQGRFESWWTPDDRQRFEERTRKLVKQFSAYRVLNDQPINGELTLGENIADLGGLQVAYSALKRAREGQADPMIDGYSQSQRLFLAWAQVWRRNYTEQELSVRLKTDTHSPGRFRANGPIKNLTEFQAAFGCQDSDPMVRSGEDRVVIW